MSWFSWLLWGFQSHWPEHRFSFTPVGVDSSFVPAPFGSQLVFFLTNSIKIEKNKHVFLFLFYNQLPFETFKFGKVKTAMHVCYLFLKLKKNGKVTRSRNKTKAIFDNYRWPNIPVKLWWDFRTCMCAYSLKRFMRAVTMSLCLP